MRLGLLVLVMLATRAHAYPQFQLSQGVDRCTACHLAPSGGGLLNDYGRDEAGSTISRGGDGRFLHGAWEPPRWAALGGDVRLASVVRARKASRDVFVFPMQADLAARLGGERLSVTFNVGVRGSSGDPQPSLVERLWSREHYVTYQRPSGSYVRAGRFFPVFGIRTQDHTVFVRRDLGMNLYEEPYGIGAGMFGDTWEAHASAFIPRPIKFLGSGPLASGATAYVEKRFLDDRAALAAQTRLAITDDDAKLAAGIVAKRFLPEAGLMILAEVDLQREAFDRGPTRYQLASYLGASTFVRRGLLIGAALQRWQPDLGLHSGQDAVQIDAQLFLRAHIELHWSTRVSAAGDDYDDPGLVSILQVHYYL